MRVSGWLSVLSGGLLAAMAAPVIAHHSFAAEFDINRPIKLDGVVTKMQFSNPHSWLHIEVTTETGEKQQWAVEGGAPNALMRHGWNRNSVPAGTKVHVDPVAVTGLLRATFVHPGGCEPGRVTVLLLPETLPALSRARTKYETVAVTGWSQLK